MPTKYKIIPIILKKTPPVVELPEIAEKLVRNNIATMENYADFCKVETGIYRNGR